MFDAARAVETIVAPATSPLPAGVAVVRLSGPLAHPIVAELSGRSDLPHALMQLATLRDPRDRSVLDRGYLVAFSAPRTFTGDDVAELHVHGSPAGVQRIVEACVALGARLAAPGEFTWRAFVAGKLDLTQAEALGDLIHAQADSQHRAALAQLDGALSRKLDTLRRPLLLALAEVEARLDFAAEPHLAQFDAAPMITQLTDLIDDLNTLAETARAGQVRLHGARVALYGPPNAGKSTLLNALVGMDRALVDATPGTTRDTLEVRTAPQGQLITWIDAAGVRQTDDRIEHLGTERAREAARTADVVLWCQDGSQPLPADLPPPPVQAHAMLLAVRTKADLPTHPQLLDHPLFSQGLAIAAQQGQGIEALRQAVVDAVVALSQGPASGPRSNAVVITRQRHAEALRDATGGIARAIGTLQTCAPLELTAADLRDAASALDEITGVMTPDDVLGEIFSAFCIGK